jgi:hypothetical protein
MAWPLSFIAPVFTLFLLGLPMPAPNLKAGIILVVALVAPMLLGMALLPFLTWMRPIAVLLVALILFHLFYFTSASGKAILGSLLTLSISVVLAVGSVNISALPALVMALGFSALSGMAFVWLAHAVLPDFPPEAGTAPSRPAKPPTPTKKEASQIALRAMLIVFPVALFIMFSSSSPSYIAVMIKVSSMGLQSSAEQNKKLGMSLLESTFWGGVGAIIGWQLIAIWPNLVFFSLLVALACLVYGRGIFQGPGLHPKNQMWSYALLTMVVLLVPAVSDSLGGSNAMSAFWSRLWLFMGIAAYGTAAAAAFDALWLSRPGPEPESNQATGQARQPEPGSSSQITE